MIDFEVYGVELIKQDTEDKLTTGNVNSQYVRFTFSDDWNDLKKTVVFCDVTETVYSVPLGSDCVAVIPSEVLLYEGWLEIGVYGSENTSDDKLIRISSKVAKMYVDKGAFVDGEVKTFSHRALIDRDAENQHPMEAIIGLVEWKNSIDSELLGLNHEIEAAMVDA